MAIRVCHYVDLPFDDVLDRLSGTGGPVMDAALVAAMTAEARREPVGEVHVTVGSLERVSRTTARAALEWQVPSDDPRTTHGEGTLSVLVANSGSNPRTELLVTIPDIAAPLHAAAARVAHGFVEQLAAAVAPGA